MNPSLYIKCPQCKIILNISLAPLCSVCLNTTKGRLRSNDRVTDQHKQFLESERGQSERRGGPKPRIKICPKCNFAGFTVRNSSGKRCMCGGCGKRVF